MADNLLSPGQLEADAVVPQCLDNQYVSDRLFSFLIEQGADYNHATVRQMREEEIKTEFTRALVYSSQVVINRAYMKNNEYLYRNFQTANRNEFLAFTSLLRDKAVVPFLYNESSIIGPSEVDICDEGETAIRRLASEASGDISCVRLAADDATNDHLSREMATRFANGVTRIGLLDPQRRNAMASELFGSPERLHEVGWEVFDNALTGLADYGYLKGRKLADQGKALSRTDVYRDHIVPSDADENTARQCIMLGRFRKPDQNSPFVHELKKITDLIYNTILPDMLGRYTFTPVTLPSRTALQDDPTAGAHQNQLRKIVTDPAALDFIRRTFMANTQRAMNLPLLRELSISDVVELRALPEWQAFKDSQKRILLDPLNCLNHFEQFQADFDRFQREMSKWYNTKYERPRTEAKYVSVVSFVVSVAGEVLACGLGKENELAKGAIRATFSELIPKKVKGYAAKLMVGVYDVGQKRLDEDRSYSIELMRTNEEMTREDVLGLINQMIEKGGAIRAGAEADQGKQ